jgi:hypothetical protein
MCGVVATAYATTAVTESAAAIHAYTAYINDSDAREVGYPVYNIIVPLYKNYCTVLAYRELLILAIIKILACKTKPIVNVIYKDILSRKRNEFNKYNNNCQYRYAHRYVFFRKQ